MRIDSHQHYMIPTQKQISKLVEADVDKAILFCSSPHPEKASNVAEVRADITNLYKILAGGGTKEDELKRLSNNIDDIVSVINSYPEYFLGFGSAPYGLSIDESGQWIESQIRAKGLKGVGEFSPSSDEQINSLEEIITALNDFPNMPIWVHTFHPVTMTGIQKLMDLCKKNPHVPIIFGHLGGVNWMDVIDFAKESKNAYLDLSGAFASLATKMAIAEVPDRCLYSSDAPFGEPLLYRQLIEYVSPNSETADMVLGENISRLLQL